MYGLLSERAFILGQVVATALLFPFQIHFLLSSQGVGKRTARRLAALIALLAFYAGVTSLWSAASMHDVFRLLFFGVAWTVSCWLGLPFLLLSQEEREGALRSLRSLTQFKAR